jgi:hypothetical protein
MSCVFRSHDEVIVILNLAVAGRPSAPSARSPDSEAEKADTGAESNCLSYPRYVHRFYYNELIIAIP